MEENLSDLCFLVGHTLITRARVYNLAVSFKNRLGLTDPHKLLLHHVLLVLIEKTQEIDLLREIYFHLFTRILQLGFADLVLYD
jgi:hypothetical protein